MNHSREFWAIKMVRPSNPKWKEAVALCEQILEDGFRAGMEHAQEVIRADNPVARSANAEIRGRCQQEIREAITKRQPH